VYPQDPRYPPSYAHLQPYPPQAPYAYGYPGASPPSAPSGAPHVLGILSIVFGGIMIASSLWGLVSAVSTAALGPVLSSLFPTSGMPAEVLQTWAICTAATSGLMLLMSVALLISGIGLVKKRPWGRSWSFWWSWVAFPVLVLRLLVWHLGMEPATAAAVASVLPGAPSLHGRHSLGFEDLWCVCLAVYPILLLALVKRRADEQGAR
jgi:hypothetical protein